MRGQSDDQIFAHCEQTRTVLITADLGFANALRFPIGSHPGMVIVRIPNEIPTALGNALVVDAIQDSLPDLRGSLLVVEPGKYRLRKGS